MATWNGNSMQIGRNAVATANNKDQWRTTQPWGEEQYGASVMPQSYAQQQQPANNFTYGGGSTNRVGGVMGPTGGRPAFGQAAAGANMFGAQNRMAAAGTQSTQGTPAGGPGGRRGDLPADFPNYQYGGATPGDWSYVLPSPGRGTPGTQANPGEQKAAPGTDAEWEWYGKNANDIAAWLSIVQQNQNAYQYGNDFNEAQRRWDAENTWRQAQDQYNMGLAGRQQQMAEWQAGTSSDQWNRQFGWTQETDRWNRDLSQQQLSQTDWYNRAQIEQARAQMQSEAATSRAVAAMQAYGRAQAPAARWVRNW